jgi:NADH:ubiquinone oxidoreductase subunit 6 (subunit J)
MDSMTTSFGEVLLWSFWFFIWIAAIMVWFRCVVDMFRDQSLSGWAKAGWAIVLIFLPWLGALIYVIARGRSMTERQMADVAQMQAQQEQYIKQVASTSTAGSSPAEQIASAKSLLDSGALTQAEFDTLKAKALA